MIRHPVSSVIAPAAGRAGYQEVGRQIDRKFGRSQASLSIKVAGFAETVS
jgi:hypothetical protein